MLNIVLYQPEIPPNTGNIARLCAATNTRLHLIAPLGFELNEKYLKRAGMDYWNFVDMQLWDNWQHFETQLTGKSFYLFTTKTAKPYWKASFQDEDYLIFGRESKGLPESLLTKHTSQCLTIPMTHPHARSLNLSTAAAMVLGEALRQYSAK